MEDSSVPIYRIAMKILDVCEQGFLLAAGSSQICSSIAGRCSMGHGVFGVPRGPSLLLDHQTGRGVGGHGCSLRLCDG